MWFYRQIARWRDKGITRVAVNFRRDNWPTERFAAQTGFGHDLNFEYCPIDVELTGCLIENDTLALSVIQQFSRSALRFIWMILTGILRFPNSHGFL